MEKCSSLFGSDRSPRTGDLVSACIRNIMLRGALKEFLKHSKVQGGSRARELQGELKRELSLICILYFANLAPPTSTNPPVQERIVGRRWVVSSVARERCDITTMTSEWVASCHNPPAAGRILMDGSTNCWTELPFECRESASSIQLKKVY